MFKVKDAYVPTITCNNQGVHCVTTNRTFNNVVTSSISDEIPPRFNAPVKWGFWTMSDDESLTVNALSSEQLIIEALGHVDNPARAHFNNYGTDLYDYTTGLIHAENVGNTITLRLSFDCLYTNILQDVKVELFTNAPSAFMHYSEVKHLFLESTQKLTFIMPTFITTTSLASGIKIVVTNASSPQNILITNAQLFIKLI
jgi:hypothetical protein